MQETTFGTATASQALCVEYLLSEMFEEVSVQLGSDLQMFAYR